MANSVESSRKIENKDNYTKFAVNFDKDVINEFEKEGFTAVIAFVTKLWRNMKVVGRKVVINTRLNNSLGEFAYKRQEGDRTITFQAFTIKLKKFEDGHNMSFF